MSTIDFSVKCKVCSGEVDRFSQNTRFILLPNSSAQEYESITMSCGCTIDFPDWDIDLSTGLCQIYNFSRQLYLEFYDEEMILEEDDE